MSKILIGKLVNTHGIKGEVRILSYFKYKDRVFFINNKLIIDNNTYIINSYRVHKNFDMVTFKGINNINDVLNLKGKSVYIDEENLKLDDDMFLNSDLVNYKVIYNNNSYKVDSYIEYPNNLIIKCINDNDSFSITLNSPSIRLDKLEKIIYINGEEGIIR